MKNKKKVGGQTKLIKKLQYGTRLNPDTKAFLGSLPNAAKFLEDAIHEKRIRDTKVKYYASGDPDPMSYP